MDDADSSDADSEHCNNKNKIILIHFMKIGHNLRFY